MDKTLKLISFLFLALAFGFLLINLQNISPMPNLDDLESGSLLAGLYAMFLTGIVLFIAAGLGLLLLKPFKISTWSFSERAAIGLALGLAAIGYGEFFLGLIGWLKPIHQIIFLGISATAAFKGSVTFLQEGLKTINGFKRTWQAFSTMKKVFFGIGGLAILLALIQTLTPPFDYDGLMYHLQGPRLFLEAGRIIPIPENWFTFYPAAWEMLYMLGMALGSDIFARLITFATMLVFILATYAFGKRFLGSRGGWLSAAIIVGTPMMLFWGGSVYIDLAWSTFQFLAIGLILIWVKKEEGPYLILAGVMQGLALGTKYTAFSGAGILLMVVIWRCTKNNMKKEGLRKGLVKPVFQFGLSALITASPWHIKNLFWTGNPIFPLFFHQDLIDPGELKIWLDYLASFGTGTRWYDYLLLPITIFSNFQQFSTFIIFWDCPNPGLLFTFAYPFVRKNVKKNREVMDVLAIISGLQFIVWMFGSQQNRFLMPLFPGLSLIASAVIMSFPSRLAKINWSRIISIGIVGGLVVCSLVLMVQFIILAKPLHVLLGVEPKPVLISYVAKDFQGIKYINENLDDDALVFMPWDGRGYYCDGKCYPDISQSKWTALVQKTENSRDVSLWLQDEHITHIMISWSDIAFFVHGHDPEGIHYRALRFLIDDFAPGCAEVVYEDDWTRLYELHYENIDCE